MPPIPRITHSASFHLADASVSELSGGEWQLVRIALVFVQGADIVMLDEPTTALDLGHQSLIARQMRQLRLQGRIVLYSTHDPVLALRMSDSVVLFDGVVPTPKALRSDSITAEQLSRTYGLPVTLTSVPGVGRICFAEGDRDALWPIAAPRDL